MNALVSLRHAAVEYRGRGRALGPVSLDIKPGEVWAVVGASGCGKSTLLRLLAGLEPPTLGAVTRAVDPGRTALVFQSPTLMPWTDAQENVALPLRLLRTPAAEAEQRAAEALGRVGLADAASARAFELSGGMAMRVSLARALVTGPSLLLLDEPFAALDSVTRRRLIEDIHALWAIRGMAMVLVTHDVEDAVYFASRVVALSAGPGRVAAEISVDGPLPRPAGFRETQEFRTRADAVSAVLEDSLRGTR